MKLNLRNTIVSAGIAALLLAVALFANEPVAELGGPLGTVLTESLAFIGDPAAQWAVYLCLNAWFLGLVLLRFRVLPGPRPSVLPTLCLGALFMASSVSYLLLYSSSMDAVTIVAAAVLAQALGMLVFWPAKEPTGIKALVVGMLFATFLAGASIWNSDATQIFQYRGVSRLSGPWRNPNTFGLLMGMGIVVASGSALAGIARPAGNPDTKASSICQTTVFERWRWPIVIGSLLLAAILSRGLLYSYSRGAWLGTFCGLVWLFKGMARLRVRCTHWTAARSLPLVLALCSGLILAFWLHRNTEWHPARRAFSAVNSADFSWQNRIAAWKGALQIMTEHPWFGAGWRQPERLYRYFYQASRVTEPMAFQMNDYLMFGASVGVPALLCLIGYLQLSLTPRARSALASAEFNSHCLRTSCQAGAVVLLLGFWFDGGLFKLATATSCLFLLDMGRESHHRRTSEEGTIVNHRGPAL